jgi:hypothetical protein
VEDASSPAVEAENMTASDTTTKSQAFRWAIFSAITIGLTALGIGVAEANPPRQDQPCSTRHASVLDADGNLMRCDRMMNGSHGLVWQYTLGS